MARIPRPGKWISGKIEKQVRDVITKVNYPTVGYGKNPRQDEPEPPYERQVHPQWIYRLRQNSTLVNNSIEEKVSQTFRRGFTEWEKEYEAKCTNCKEEFENLDPFKEQLGAFGENLEDEEIDLDSPRVCPECDQLSEIDYPSEQDKEDAEDFFRQANEKTDVQSHLEPLEQNSVGQPFLEVCKELAWDIQSFDDAWLLFEREYMTDPESGVILDYELKEVHRAPPELMRYSIREDGNFGGEYWVCPECRSKGDDYKPEKEPSECSECGGYTYEVYAMALDQPGGEPQSYFIRGEFVHASEYEPGKYYGYSPILTLWEESRTLENMDEWYKSAYKERRAPRGAMLIRSSNAESVRAFNKGQMEKLRNDKHYIPTFIDDTEGSGKALEWVNLLEDPAEMQHMEMRDWFLERISAKYGVTSAFQKGSPNNSGLSQSLEIVVSNRSADRLRRIFNTTFIPALIGQLDVDGWDRELRPVEEEDEDAEADIQSKFLQNATNAEKAGFEYEWTDEDRLKIYPGKPNSDEEEGGDEPPGEGGPPGGGVQAGGSPADATGGAPGTPSHQDPRLEEQDASVDTGSSGWGNARYGGSGEEIDVLGHLRDLLEEEGEKLNKSKEDLSWSDIDISETVRVWIEDPKEAPDNADITHEPDNAPEDSDAEYYYEENISTTDLGKIQKINNTAVVVDFFWRPSPAGLIGLDIEKGEGEYDPYEPPEDCNRQYLEAAGLTEGDVAEAQIFEGPQGKQFYCKNWKQVGAWNEDSGPYDAQKPIAPKDKVNEQLKGDQKLNEYEEMFDFDGFNEVDKGQTLIINAADIGDNWEKLDLVEVKYNDRVIVKDEDGNNTMAQLSDLQDRVEGVVGEVHSEKYEGRYEMYEPPRDIYSPEHVENKQGLPGGMGGINSKYTREVTFDNGEQAIYKNYHGNSHEGTLDGEVIAYELSELISSNDTFPETARTDLKNGFGSAQLFIDNAKTVDEAKSAGWFDSGKESMEMFVRNNADRIAEMAMVDYMTGNGDRHNNNYMVDEDMNLYAIDNGGHSPPDPEPSDDNLYTLFKYLGRDLLKDDDVDRDDVKDILEGLFDAIEDSHEQMVENLVAQEDKAVEMADEFYGPMSPGAERIAALMEETDDGNLKIEEKLQEDMQEVADFTISRVDSWRDPV